MSGDVAALCDEVAALRGEIEALARLAGICYEAGRSDVLHGTPQRVAQMHPRNPRRGRAKLALVREETP